MKQRRSIQLYPFLQRFPDRLFLYWDTGVDGGVAWNEDTHYGRAR